MESYSPFTVSAALSMLIAMIKKRPSISIIQVIAKIDITDMLKFLPNWMKACLIV